MMTTFDDNDADRTNMCLWWRSTSPPSFTLSRLSPGFCHHHHHVDDNHSGIIPTSQCCHLFSALNHVSVSLRTVHLSQGNIWPALGDFYTYLWFTHCSALWHNSFVFVEHIIWIAFLLLTYFVLWGFFATFISKDYAEKNVWFRQVNVGAAPSGPQLIEQFYKKVENWGETFTSNRQILYIHQYHWLTYLPPQRKRTFFLQESATEMIWSPGSPVCDV